MSLNVQAGSVQTQDKTVSFSTPTQLTDFSGPGIYQVSVDYNDTGNTGTSFGLILNVEINSGGGYVLWFTASTYPTSMVDSKVSAGTPNFAPNILFSVNGVGELLVEGSGGHLEKEFASIGATYEIVQEGLLGQPYYLAIEFDDGSGIFDRYMYGIAAHVDVSATDVVTINTRFFAVNSLTTVSVDATQTPSTSGFSWVITTGASSQPDIGIRLQAFNSPRIFTFAARAMTGTLSNIKFSLARF